MTVCCRRKKQLVVPKRQAPAGIKPCDRLELKVSGGIINIIPMLPSADEEYTQAQRRVMDAQLKEAAKGACYGREIRKRKADKTKRTRR